MKRIAFCLLWLFLVLPVHAQEYDYVAGSGGAAASCTTASDSEIFSPVTQPGTSKGETAYNAVKITLASETTITTYKVRICDANSDVGSVSTGLYNDDGNGATSKPTTLVADTSKNLASSSFVNCDSNSVIDFDLATPKVVSAGTYWIVSWELDSANRANWYPASSTGNRVCYSANGSSWTCADNAAYDMELWGCQ